jgi:Uri superfamily endonuclease
LPHTSFLEAFVTKTSLDLECRIADAMGKRLMPVPRFGCSDCRCISHLHYSPALGEMRAAVAAAHSATMI